MSKEIVKTPWQQAHEEMLLKEIQEKRTRKRKARVAFLRQLTFTRKSDKNLRSLAALQETSHDSEEETLPSSEGPAESENVPDKNQRPSVKLLQRQKIKKSTIRQRVSNALQEILPVFRRLWPTLLIFFLIFLGALYATSPLSKVGDFKISGNTLVTSNAVATASDIHVDSSITSLILHGKAIEAKVTNSDPRIETTRLEIDSLNHVTLKIKEYESIGYVSQNGQNYLLLSNGVVAQNDSVSTIKVANNALVLENFSNSQAKAFSQAYATLSASLKSLIRQVTLTPTQTTSDFITLHMSDGNQVKVPLSQMKEKLPYYPSIAKNLTAPETVDMEVGFFAAPTAEYDNTFKNDVPSKPSASSSSKPSSSSSAQ